MEAHLGSGIFFNCYALGIFFTRVNRTTRRILPPIDRSNRLGTLSFSGADEVHQPPTCLLKNTGIIHLSHKSILVLSQAETAELADEIG